MTMPGNGSVLTTARIDQLSAPGSVGAQSTIRDSRSAFHSVDGYFARGPENDKAPIFYAPRVIDGPTLEQVRAWLAVRATPRAFLRVA